MFLIDVVVCVLVLNTHLLILLFVYLQSQEKVFMLKVEIK